MIDRLPANPRRVKITDEATGAVKYVVWGYADNPIVEGTPLNKNNLLSDETAAALLPGVGNPTPDIAFKKVVEVKNTAESAMPKGGGTMTGPAVGMTAPVDTAVQFRNMVIYPAGTDLATIKVPAGTIICILK